MISPGRAKLTAAPAANSVSLAGWRGLSREASQRSFNTRPLPWPHESPLGAKTGTTQDRKARRPAARVARSAEPRRQSAAAARGEIPADTPISPGHFQPPDLWRSPRSRHEIAGSLSCRDAQDRGLWDLSSSLKLLFSSFSCADSNNFSCAPGTQRSPARYGVHEALLDRNCPVCNRRGCIGRRRQGQHGSRQAVLGHGSERPPSIAAEDSGRGQFAQRLFQAVRRSAGQHGPGVDEPRIGAREAESRAGQHSLGRPHAGPQAMQDIGARPRRWQRSRKSPNEAIFTTRRNHPETVGPL